MIHPVGTQTIETERCILRRIAPGDAHLMYENWARHEEVYRFFPFDPIESEEAYREKVCKWAENDESGSYFHWVIVWKENGEPVGTINLGHVEEDCLMSDTAYMLSPRYWNRGIMTETVRAVLRYAFERVGLNRVQAEVFDGNAASARVLQKCGMRLEGTARQRYRKDGAWVDVHQYAAVKGDFEK